VRKKNKRWGDLTRWRAREGEWGGEEADENSKQKCLRVEGGRWDPQKDGTRRGKWTTAKEGMK